MDTIFGNIMLTLSCILKLNYLKGEELEGCCNPSGKPQDYMLLPSVPSLFLNIPLQDALSGHHLYIHRHIEGLLLGRHCMFNVWQTNCVYWTWRFLCLTPFHLTGWRKSQDTPRSAESPRVAIISPLFQSVGTVNNKGRVIFLDSNNRTWQNILKLLYTKKSIRVQIV